MVISDSQIVKNPELLLRDIEHLLKDNKAREKLAEAFHDTADITAANKLADIIIGTANGTRA